MMNVICEVVVSVIVGKQYIQVFSENELRFIFCRLGGGYFGISGVLLIVYCLLFMGFVVLGSYKWFHLVY